MTTQPKPRIHEVKDAVSEFLSDPNNRETTYPMNGLPPIGEGTLTDEEEAFLAKSTFEVLRD